MQGSEGGEDILILQQQTGCQESGSGPGTALTSDVASGKSTFWASVSSPGERDELDDNWGAEIHTLHTIMSGGGQCLISPNSFYRCGFVSPSQYTQDCADYPIRRAAFASPFARTCAG